MLHYYCEGHKQGKH